MRQQGTVPPVSAPAYRWVVLAVGALGAAAFAALRMGLPGLGPVIRARYDLELSEVGLAFTAVGVGVMLTLLPWGVLTDRVGERPVLSAGLALSSVALAGAAFAPDYPTLLLGLLLAAMAGASATGASGRAVMGWFSRDERGFALGIRQMALPVGGALAAFALPHFGALRPALLTLAAVALGAAGVNALFLRDAPPAPAAALAYSAAQPPPLRDARQWRLGAGSALLVVAQVGLTGFLALFLVDLRGLSATAAAAVLAVTQLGAAASRLLAGRRSDRTGLRLPLLRTVAKRNAALLLALAAVASAPDLLLFPVLMAAGVSVMTWNGLSFTAAAELSGRVRAGTAMSMQNTIVAVGSAISPFLFGTLVEATSWPAAFGLLAAAPAAAALVLAPLQDEERLRRAHRSTTPTHPRPARLAA